MILPQNFGSKDVNLFPQIKTIHVRKDKVNELIN
jgi:hypothetical protein